MELHPFHHHGGFHVFVVMILNWTSSRQAAAKLSVQPFSSWCAFFYAAVKCSVCVFIFLGFFLRSSIILSSASSSWLFLLPVYYFITHISNVQENHASGRNSYNWGQARLEERNENYLPGERKRAAQRHSCWSCLHHWWKATRCVHKGGEWSGHDTENIVGGSADRLHCSSYYAGWQKPNHTHQYHNPSKLWGGCSKGRNADSQGTLQKREPKDQIQHQVPFKANKWTEGWNQEIACTMSQIRSWLLWILSVFFPDTVAIVQLHGQFGLVEICNGVSFMPNNLNGLLLECCFFKLWMDGEWTSGSWVESMTRARRTGEASLVPTRNCLICLFLIFQIVSSLGSCVWMTCWWETVVLFFVAIDWKVNWVEVIILGFYVTRQGGHCRSFICKMFLGSTTSCVAQVMKGHGMQSGSARGIKWSFTRPVL